VALTRQHPAGVQEAGQQRAGAGRVAALLARSGDWRRDAPRGDTQRERSGGVAGQPDVMYFLPDEGPPATIRPDLWSVPADGSGAPQRLQIAAFSPAAVR